MRRECRERFPLHRLHINLLGSDPGMHHGTCVTHVPWCMSGSLARVDGGNVPGIPGACTTRNLTYLARGPSLRLSDSYMRDWIWSSLVHVIDWFQFFDEQLQEQILTYCQVDTKEEILYTIIEIWYPLQSICAFGLNVLRKMVAAPSAWKELALFSENRLNFWLWYMQCVNKLATLSNSICKMKTNVTKSYFGIIAYENI